MIICLCIRCFPFNLDGSGSENEIDIDSFIAIWNVQCLDVSGNFKDRSTYSKDGKPSYKVVNIAKGFSCSICISLDYLHIYKTINQSWHH